MLLQFNSFEGSALAGQFEEIKGCGGWNGVFQGCAELRKVIFGANLRTIGQRAFYGCAIDSIVLPEGVTTIGASAFKNCQELSTIVWPNSIKNIEDDDEGLDDVFEDCKSLHDLAGSSYKGDVIVYLKK